MRATLEHVRPNGSRTQRGALLETYRRYKPRSVMRHVAFADRIPAPLLAGRQLAIRNRPAHVRQRQTPLRGLNVLRLGCGVQAFPPHCLT
jgi:hypothetical protein